LFFNDINYITKKFFEDVDGKLKNGIYELLNSRQKGFYIKQIDIKNIITPILNENILEKLNSDINGFFNNKLFYEKNNIPYKRGIMLYGSPGNGKTTFVKYLLSKCTKYYSMIITIDNFNDEVEEMISSSFPKSGQKILVFEDIDSLPRYQRSSFLNFLDGIKTLENCVVIATTNYPEKVDPALLSRPSRFDKLYRIDEPKSEARKEFLIKYFPKLSKNELDIYIQKTNDFSGAYFLELFKLVEIQKISISDAIDSLSSQIKMCKSYKFNNEKSIGFNDDDQ